MRREQLTSEAPLADLSAATVKYGDRGFLDRYEQVRREIGDLESARRSFLVNIARTPDTSPASPLYTWRSCRATVLAISKSASKRLAPRDFELSAWTSRLRRAVQDYLLARGKSLPREAMRRMFPSTEALARAGLLDDPLIAAFIEIRRCSAKIDQLERERACMDEQFAIEKEKRVAAWQSANRSE